MTMTKLAATPLLLLVAACGGNDVSADGQPDAGMYVQQVKVTDIDFPDMTEATKASVISQMERASGNGQSYCMGAQGAPDWKEAAEVLSKGLGGTCTELDRKEGPASLDLHMQCKNTPKGDVDLKFAAKASETSFTANAKFDFDHQESGDTAKLAVELSAKRIGDCPSS